MNAISQSDFLQALGWAVMNSLWQMALLWIVYQLLTAVFHLQKSAQKATLASSLLFAGFTWFVFTFLIVLEKNPQASTYIKLVNFASSNETLNQWFAGTLPWASLVYLVLLVLPILNFVRNYRYVRHIRQNGISKAGVEWRIFVKNIAGHLGIRKPVQIWMSDLVTSPVTIGYLKPVILLPVAALSQLNTKQIEAVLLHELSHIKRMDYLTNLITRIIQTILYFNPFVKAFARIIENEREKSCDEMVIQFQYEPVGYATALLELEKSARISAMQTLTVAAAGGQKNQLLHRIESILGIRKKEVFSFHKLAGVLSAVICFLALNALVIMSKPGRNRTAQGIFLPQLSSPVSFFVPMDNTDKVVPAVEEMPRQIITTAPVEQPVARQSSLSVVIPIEAPAVAKTDLEKINPAMTDGFIKETVDNATTHFVAVANVETMLPELTPQQESQVKEALIASKKVLNETQWKTVEKSIADAMTVAEKEKVKAAFDKAAATSGNAEMDKMYDRLRASYDQINWEKLNTQLNIAVNNIRLDSLRQVYSLAMMQLSSLEKEMKQQGLKGIPDSDITVDAVQKKIQELQKARMKVQDMRVKKVISL
ncbi:MAG: hypothetical protein DI535_12670 [Citrobacter freundii]|nr:MAG: hypothetical protein DI535_12670 [Citrobacter freundii]